jgi:hypothetical protein
MLEFSDALPCSQRAKSIQSDLSTHLSQSLSHLIDISDEVIEQADVLRQFFDKPTNSPLLYCINAEWLEAVQNEDIDRVRLCSSLLHELISKPALPTFLNFDAFQFSKPLTDMLFKHMTATFPEKDQVWIKKAPCDQYDRSVDLIEQALLVLKDVDLTLYEEVQQLIKNYVLCDSNRVVYGSSFSLFGMIFLKAFDNTQNLFDMIEMVVHESAHHYIFAVSVFDPIVLNAPTELFTSPFRKDPRPMIGVYHAAFVLGRLLYIFSKLLNYAGDVQVSTQQILDKIKDFEARFKFSVDLILQEAKLTEIGRRLILSTQAMTQNALSSAFKSAA